jgi:hypothetical protein
LLARTFDSADHEIQQRSGQAMLRIGGPAAAEALVGLALHGASGETQTYAALLLLLSRGRDDPAVHRLEAAGPSPEVRHVIEHGFEFRDTHQH